MNICPYFDLLEPLTSLNKDDRPVQIDLTTDEEQETIEADDADQEDADDNEPELIALAPEDEQCFQAAKPSTVTPVGRSARWDDDHARADSRTTMEVVLDWLNSGNNFVRWKEAKDHRVKVLCVECVCLRLRVSTAKRLRSTDFNISIRKAVRCLSKQKVTNPKAWRECNDIIKHRVLPLF